MKSRDKFCLLVLLVFLSISACGQDGKPEFNNSPTQVTGAATSMVESTAITGDVTKAATPTILPLLTQNPTAADQVVPTVDPFGSRGLVGAFGARISADGQYIVYVADFLDLIPGFAVLPDPDYRIPFQIYIYDVETGHTHAVSKDASDRPAEFGVLDIADDRFLGRSSSFLLSPDGTKVIFHANATNLSPDDPNNYYQGDRFSSKSDTYIYDLSTGIAVRVPLPNEIRPEFGSYPIAIAGEGSQLIYRFDTTWRDEEAGTTYSEPNNFYYYEFETGRTENIPLLVDLVERNPLMSRNGTVGIIDNEVFDLLNGTIQEWVGPPRYWDASEIELADSGNMIIYLGGARVPEHEYKLFFDDHLIVEYWRTGVQVEIPMLPEAEVQFQANPSERGINQIVDFTVSMNDQFLFYTARFKGKGSDPITSLLIKHDLITRQYSIVYEGVTHFMDVSANGRFVTFHAAPDEVEGVNPNNEQCGTGTCLNVFLLDTETGELQQISK